jgi:hypothetical protein
VISVWRNKAKEEAINTIDPRDIDEIHNLETTMFNSLFSVHKQRGDKGEEPQKRLWYNKDSRHYNEEHKPEMKGFV